jgi:hypothetical protein
LSNALFTLLIVTFVLASCTLVGIPFAIAAFVFVVKARRQASTQLSFIDALQSQRDEADLRAAQSAQDAASLGAMDVQQRRDMIHKLDNDIQQSRKTMDEELQRSRQTLADLGKQIADESKQAERLRVEVLDLQGWVAANDYGLYNFENPAQDSMLVGEKLKSTQVHIKQMVKNKTATSASTDFTLNGSRPKGQKMVNDMAKLLLRAFNAEAENCVKTVKAGRLPTARERLRKSSAAVERLGRTMDIRISSRYLMLRDRELQLTHEHLEAVKAQKEEERAERARQREEAQAKREFEAAKAKQMKEVQAFQTALEQLQAKGDLAGVATVQAQLSAAQELLDDIQERMTQTRAGHVYVISNVGAFGRGMVKIGMTRRLNPENRVRELGDASVPFLFDQHAMIFSPDAYGLEAALHNYFADRRVNLINMRREYFYATPSEVRDALVHIGDAHVLEFNEAWSAPEFRQTQELRQQRGLPAVPAHSLAGMMSESTE